MDQWYHMLVASLKTFVVHIQANYVNKNISSRGVAIMGSKVHAHCHFSCRSGANFHVMPMNTTMLLLRYD